MTSPDSNASHENGAASDLEALGRRLRDMRKARDLTQVQIADILNTDHTNISRIENGKYPLSPKMRRAVERVLSLGAIDGYETWFMSYLEIEQQATALVNWEPLVVPGLLQTERYARAMARAGRPGDSDAEVEQLVAGRIARQSIWQREQPPPPMFTAIIGEAVLRQMVGSAEVMRAQLEHLIATTRNNPRVTVQVMPFSFQAHPGMLGPFVLASVERPRDVAYLDNAMEGRPTERAKHVARLSLLCDTLMKEALSPGDSAGMIGKAVQEWT